MAIKRTNGFANALIFHNTNYVLERYEFQRRSNCARETLLQINHCRLPCSCRHYILVYFLMASSCWSADNFTIYTGLTSITDERIAMTLDAWIYRNVVTDGWITQKCENTASICSFDLLISSLNGHPAIQRMTCGLFDTTISKQSKYYNFQLFWFVLFPLEFQFIIYINGMGVWKGVSYLKFSTFQWTKPVIHCDFIMTIGHINNEICNGSSTCDERIR